MGKSKYNQDDVQGIVEKYNVSKRTARRHLARGTEPDEHRVIGRDGKKYPGGLYARPRVWSSPLKQTLMQCRSDLRRVAKAGQFTEDDYKMLQQIVNEGRSLLAQWEQAIQDADT